ncbi:MAG TPA: hypothetical protein VG712_02240 [Gemmatimonadales bacterium]|nr:hypothetical protein [Gemmatimonadales bacterium]
MKTALEAMRSGDTLLLGRMLASGTPMRIAGWRDTPAGPSAAVRSDSGAGWLTGIAGSAVGALDERIAEPTVQIDGNLANVWAYYEFFRGTEFSHCGADQFVLGRTSGGWKIIALNYSVRLTGCRRDLVPTPRQLALREMVRTERAFAQYADTGGTPAAFVWALRDDAITLTGEGVAQMKPMYASRRRGPALLSWAPSWADMSEDGTMGVTTGPWEWRPARDSAVAQRGNFLTIWVKGPERWQVALDLGVSGDSTAHLDEEVAEQPAGVGGRARLSDLVDLDKDRIKGDGWLEALRRLATPDVRVLRDNAVRGTGPDALTGARSIRFAPLGGRVAPSGDLGATWGTWRDGNARGSYVRIWKRTAEGWRVVVDRMGE